MRVYVRTGQHCRPVAVDVGPSLSVGVLRKNVGAEALYLATRAGGARFCELPPGSSASLLEPLDDAVLVVSAVPPHATLTAGKRPVQSRGAVSSGDLQTGVISGQWCLKRNPTPVVTSSNLHKSEPARRRDRAVLEEYRRKCDEQQSHDPPKEPFGSSIYAQFEPSLLDLNSQQHSPTQQSELDRPEASAVDSFRHTAGQPSWPNPVVAMGFDQSSRQLEQPHEPVPDSSLCGQAATEPSEALKSGDFDWLPDGGLQEDFEASPPFADQMLASEQPLKDVEPGVSMLEQALRQHQAQRAEFFEIFNAQWNDTCADDVLRAEGILGIDWEELSVVEDVEPDDFTAGEGGAWDLANEIVQNALLEGDRASHTDSNNSSSPSPNATAPLLKRHSASEGIRSRHSTCGILERVVPEGSPQEEAPESLVFTWGDNSSGQCLVGDIRQSVYTPEHVPLRCLCTSLCCGSHCSILVTKRGTLWGGGCNSGGTPSEEACGQPSTKPNYVDLAELENFDLAAVAAGCEHILALTNKGVLLSWASSNMEGQVGVGSGGTGRVIPRTLAWPPQLLRCSVRIATITCGDAHSLALTDGGEVYSFGSNVKGQLGLGESVERALEPVVVGGKTRGTPFRAVAAGMEHSMALTVSGSVFAWGSNSHGCLGLGKSKSGYDTISSPALVPGLPGAVRYIAAGGSHSAVIVQKGRLHLVGDNTYGQLGQPVADVPTSHDYLELSPCFGLCSRSIALGQEHSLLLTYNGELHAFGRNIEGQCGLIGWKDEKFIDRPVRVWLPSMPNRDGPLIVWAVSAGRHHNVVLCSGGPEEDRVYSPDTVTKVQRTGIPRRRATAEYLPGRFWPGKGSCTALQGGQKEPIDSELVVAPARRLGVEMQSQSSGHNVASFAVLRPIAQPGSVPNAFMVLSVSWLGSLLTESNPTVQTEMRSVLATVLSRPSVLNASFCYPGVRRARLDAAGLCKALALLCARVEGLTQQILEAATEGLQTLSKGAVEDLFQRDQLRCLAVYLCLPLQRSAQTPGKNPRATLCSKIAHVVMRMPTSGRTAFRDLLADECGDMRVLRDFLVPQVRNLADDAIRHVGQQPWLAGPLWEVVAQLQLQRALWQAVLLLQLLASACEHAVQLLRPDKAADCGDEHFSRENSWTGSALDTSGGTGISGSLAAQTAQRNASAFPARLALLDLSAFELTSLAEGSIPPELEFWLFQEHAQFHQITPTEVVDEPLWSDAAGMLPHRFCSFMAHANLVPIAFKQRVLQVENVLRQRLSQEQVLWPQAAMVLGGGRADPAAFYFMLNVSRQHLLRDTFAQMYSASPVELRRPLRVEFAGEEAIDEGGVMREFFRLLSAELFAPDAGLFVEAEESRRLWFSPKLGPGRQLEDYWMVGVIVALAVYNNHPGMDVPLPAALFKKLKDQPTIHEDLAQLFPAHARSLEVILTWEPTRPADSPAAMAEADREFSDTFCMSYCFSANDDAPESPLCEGGLDRPVLFSDREEFAACVHEHLLHKSVQPQFESFARGFRRVCNSPLFDVLSPIELEAIVAGDKDLDFSRLQLGVQYEGYSAEDPYIQSFWTVLESFSVLRRRRFLAFCTGSDVAPAGGLQDLHLLIQKHGAEPTMRLPVAHTCFNLLLLPQYGSVDKLRMMLVTAIEWTEGFGLQ